jgi:hypothetical protein
MKTAIQQAISELKEIREEEMAAGWEGEAYAYDTAISILKDLLEKEKKQIIDAWVNGDNSDCLSEQDSSDFAKQYYNETFNTNEK